MKNFLFLQGPHGAFFKELAYALKKQGHCIHRVNLCGGDWYDWHGEHTQCFRKNTTQWSSWISSFMQEKGITDLLLFGDWRSFHQEAILIAKTYGIRIWVFEEGYMRPSYITMERNGVNGNSSLPKTLTELEWEYSKINPKLSFLPPTNLPNSLAKRMLLAFNYSAIELLARPFFPFYSTHRPNGILKELFAWILRLPMKQSRRRFALKTMRNIYHSQQPYVLFPLQLDSDSQVRRHSPFSGMRDAISYIISSFAMHAPKDLLLVIKNHPLDNGMINYKVYIENFAKSCNVKNRVFFIDVNNITKLVEKSQAMIVLNSTIGVSALKKGVPVYCIGTSIYSLQGLAVNILQQSLADFWCKPIPPSPRILEKFETIVKSNVLINGNFYSKKGIYFSVKECGERLNKSEQYNNK